MRSFLLDVPLFLPALVIAIGLGLATARRLSARLACGRAPAFLLVLSLGVIFGATVTPLSDALGQGDPSTGVCDMDRVGWAGPRSYLSVTEESMNVLLFVPLGLAIGLIRGRAGRWLAMVALGLPVAIEATQLFVPVLGRSCEASDLIDNPTGLVVGLVAGALARTFRTTLARREDVS